jgi:protein-S-isoprenylcysteine O-methyltransferase Ste14
MAALRGHLKGFPDLPPIWLLAALAAAWALGRTPVPPLFPGAMSVGAILIAAALGLIGWAAVWFRRKRTPIEPHHVPRALIVEGPFRLSRNPIYLALVVVALGFALRQPSAMALLAVPALWWVLDRRFVRPEEAGLRAAFGAEAECFLARTRRWL